MVVGIGVARPIGLERTGGLVTLGVAQIGRDNAKLAPELVEWVERVRREPRDRRVEPAAGDYQQREPRADIFVMDANLASFIERHGFSTFSNSCRYHRSTVITARPNGIPLARLPSEAS